MSKLGNWPFISYIAYLAMGISVLAAENRSTIIYHSDYVEADIIESDPYEINTPYFFLFGGQGPDTVFMKSGKGTLTFNSTSAPIVLRDILFEDGTIEIASGDISVSRNLAFSAGTTLSLDPLRSALYAATLNLDALSGSKIGISLLDFKPLNEGETLTIFTFGEFAGDYGMGMDADLYFNFLSGDGYHFEWAANQKALLLVPGSGPVVPETATYALILGMLALGLIPFHWRRFAVDA